MSKAFILTAILLSAIVGFGSGFIYFHQRGQVTTMLLSPDGKVRAVLVEKPSFMDRNFEVRLEVWDGSWKVTRLFTSPDEGRPIGSERFMWAHDNKKLLLVGRHFFTKGDVTLSTGESLYLLYDVPSKRIWCNSPQQDRYPPFTLADLADTDFGVPLLAAEAK